MKSLSRVVAVCAVAALTLGTPSAAFAGGSEGSKGKTTSAQKASKKAGEARKKAEERRKKDARARFTFPGTVTELGNGTVTIARKHRGVTVSRTFVLGPNAELKRDGVRGAAPQVGDRAVAKGQKKDGVFVVRKLNASAPEAEQTAPAPDVVPVGTTPKVPTPEAQVGKDGSVLI